jgi:hypothetical protein
LLSEYEHTQDNVIFTEEINLSPLFWNATVIFRHFLDKKSVSSTNVCDSQRQRGAHWERSMVTKLEKLTERRLKPQKRGPKSKTELNIKLI